MPLQVLGSCVPAALDEPGFSLCTGAVHGDVPPPSHPVVPRQSCVSAPVRLGASLG